MTTARLQQIHARRREYHASLEYLETLPPGQEGPEECYAAIGRWLCHGADDLEELLREVEGCVKGEET